MSHSYFTRKLLNIKDKNIKFQEDYLEAVKLNGVTSFVFKGILSYQPTHCEHCGTLFNSKFKKYGFKTSRIVIPKVSLHDTYLDVKKQCYYCGHCQSTFTIKTSIIEKNCYISYNTKHTLLYTHKIKSLSPISLIVIKCLIPLSIVSFIVFMNLKP